MRGIIILGYLARKASIQAIGRTAHEQRGPRGLTTSLERGTLRTPNNKAFDRVECLGNLERGGRRSGKGRRGRTV